MNQSTRIFVSLIFAGIALFMLNTSCVPNRQSLKQDSAKVTQIIPKKNTWYEVEILTTSGTKLTCKGKRGGPAMGPDRCPIEKFEALIDKTVHVSYKNHSPYEVKLGGMTIIDYEAFQKSQKVAIFIAGLMSVMAIGVWKIN